MAGDKVCKQPGAGKYRPAKSEAELLFEQLDLDKDGALNLKEFAAYLKAKNEDFAFEECWGVY